MDMDIRILELETCMALFEIVKKKRKKKRRGRTKKKVELNKSNN